MHCRILDWYTYGKENFVGSCSCSTNYERLCGGAEKYVEKPQLLQTDSEKYTCSLPSTVPECYLVIPLVVTFSLRIFGHE